MVSYVRPLVYRRPTGVDLDFPALQWLEDLQPLAKSVEDLKHSVSHGQDLLPDRY